MNGYALVQVTSSQDLSLFLLFFPLIDVKLFNVCLDYIYQLKGYILD